MDKKKLARDFSKFFAVGLVWTIINIFLMWVTIDVGGMPGWLGSSIVVIISFFGRYYHYLYVNLIEREFGKYAVTNILFGLLTVGGMSLAVDVLQYPAKFSAPVVVGLLYVVKFAVFEKTGLIKR